jgi:hypothetical protein
MLALLRQERKRLFTLIALLAILCFGGTPYVLAVEISVTGNGSGSTNEVTTQVVTETTIVQSNNGNVSNDVNTSADTGSNTASENTGGTTAIETGDASQNVSVETAVNTSSVETPCCASSTDITVSGNGADSQNTVDLIKTQETTITIDQNAKIKNKVSGSANTGGNTANDNNGSVSIKTGDIHVSGGIENGPINVHNVSASAPSEDLSVKVSGNGSGSQNNVSLNVFDPTNVFITSNADIDNFAHWDLNTGKNEANGNNGDVSIETGDIIFDFLIKNGPINIGGVDIECCHLLPPPPDGGGDHPEGGGGPDGGQTPDGGQPSGSSSSSSSSSGSSDGGAGGPGVIGLSNTSSPAAQALFFFAGLVMMGYGASLIGKEAKDRLSK